MPSTFSPRLRRAPSTSLHPLFLCGIRLITTLHLEFLDFLLVFSKDFELIPSFNFELSPSLDFEPVLHLQVQRAFLRIEASGSLFEHHSCSLDIP
ncbi:hypothetical protein EV122DRAFT_285361 [Schizophyllum commune]